MTDVRVKDGTWTPVLVLHGRRNQAVGLSGWQDKHSIWGYYLDSTSSRPASNQRYIRDKRSNFIVRPQRGEVKHLEGFIIEANIWCLHR